MRHYAHMLPPIATLELVQRRPKMAVSPGKGTLAGQPKGAVAATATCGLLEAKIGLSETQRSPAVTLSKQNLAKVGPKSRFSLTRAHLARGARRHMLAVNLRVNSPFRVSLGLKSSKMSPKV